MLSIAKQCNLFRRNNIIHHILPYTPCTRIQPIICQICPMADYKSQCGGSHKVTYKQYVATVHKDHDYKNMALKRPMSPHLTIYVPTMPAMTSIVQRITGTILTGFALLLASGTLFLSNGIDTYVSMIQSLDMSSFSIFLVKLLIGAPFCYHYFFGIRFCVWNAGKWLALKDVYDSGYKCLIAAGVMTVLWAFL